MSRASTPGLELAALAWPCLAGVLAACGLPAPQPAACARAGVAGPPGLQSAAEATPFDAVRFVALSKVVYVDPAASPADRDRVQGSYASAARRVEDALGPRTSRSPVAMFCKSDACRAAYPPSGRSRGIRFGESVPWGTYTAADPPAVLIDDVGPGMDAVLAHEMVHVEMGARTYPATVPSWFDEGAATFLADAPDCAGQPGQGIDDLRRLDDRAVLFEYTAEPGTNIRVYCQARAEVDAWLHRHGKPGLFALLNAIKTGGSFYDVYGPMLTQSAGPVTTIVSSPSASLGDPSRPFSLVAWVKPSADAGVLAHVSSRPEGTGWRTPFLGFDASGHLVAQVLHGTGPDPSSYAVARGATFLAVGKWTYVAMTWAPGSPTRLYVDGSLSAEAPSSEYRAPGPGSPMYVAWGSTNAGGAQCFQGAIGGGAFQGSMTDMSTYDVALDAAQIAGLAARRP